MYHRETQFGPLQGPRMKDAVPLIVGITILFIVLSAFFLATRCYVRIKKRGFGIDDWFIVIGWGFYILLTIVVIGGALSGVGLKDENMAGPKSRSMPWGPNSIRIGEWLFFTQLSQLISALLVKISICITLLRLAPRPAFKYAIYAVIGIMTIQSIITAVFVLVSCQPVSYHWNRLSVHGKCDMLEEQQQSVLAYTVISVLTDVFCAIFPVVLLWKVQMNMRTKLVVWFLMGLGVLASIFSTVRLHKLVVLHFPQYLYQSGFITLLTVVEVGFGIIAASASTFRPLFRKFFESESIIDSRIAAHKERKEMTRGVRPDDITHAKAALAKKRKIQDPDAISFDLTMRSPDESSIKMKQANRSSIITTRESDCSSESRGGDVHEPQDASENSKGNQGTDDTRDKQHDANDWV